MITKSDAKKVSQWSGDQNNLIKYGIYLTPLTADEIKNILTTAEREDLIKDAIPNNCVAEMYPHNGSIFCTLWIQIKGWYGASKSYVKFSPHNENSKKLYLEIAKKHDRKIKPKETIKEEMFNY